MSASWASSSCERPRSTRRRLTLRPKTVTKSIDEVGDSSALPSVPQSCHFGAMEIMRNANASGSGPIGQEAPSHVKRRTHAGKRPPFPAALPLPSGDPAPSQPNTQSVRLNQLDMRHAQGLGELVQRHDRGIPPPAFEIADVLLGEAGPLRELFLRQVALKPDAPHIAADESAHVHTRGSQAPPPGVYLL